MNEGGAVATTTRRTPFSPHSPFPGKPMPEGNVLEGAERLPNDRCAIYSNHTGKRYERGAEQAAEMIRSGQFRVNKEAQEAVPPLERTTDQIESAHKPAVSVAPSVEPKSRRKQGK